MDANLRDNILFGLNSNKYGDSKIINLIKKINLENLFRLPNGLDEILVKRNKFVWWRNSRWNIKQFTNLKFYFWTRLPVLLIYTETQILNELKIFKEKQ